MLRASLRQNRASCNSDIALPRAASASVSSERSEQTRLRNSSLPFVKSEMSQLTPPRAGRLRSFVSPLGFSYVLNAMHYLGPTAKAAQEEGDGSEGTTLSQPYPPADGELSRSSSDTELGARDLGTAHYETRQPHGRELCYDLDEYQEQIDPARPLPQARKADNLKPLAPLRHRKLIKSVVALLILVGLAAIISWQWPHLSELYRSVAQIVAKQQSSQAVPQTASQSSFLDRFPQEQDTAATGTPGGQTSPTVGQRVVLYEEELTLIRRASVTSAWFRGEPKQCRLHRAPTLQCAPT